MKKIFLALMCVSFFASCSLWDAMKYAEEIKDGADDSFEGYDGMNVSEKPLTGTPFVLPAGFVIDNIIKGEANQSDENDQEEDFKITDSMFGSGLFIIVTMTIKNESTEAQILKLPRGLMLQADTSLYQNGILVKDTEIKFKGEEIRQVSVRFYCLNASAHGSDSDSKYNLSYVTNIAAFQPLFNVCEEKKINIEEYKTIGILSYYSNCTVVQEIVWAITKNKKFTEAEIRKYLKHVKAA